MSHEYSALQARKRKFIPLACQGKISISQAAAKIGITPRAVSYLKRRYRLHGAGVFVNGHKGKRHKSNKYNDFVCRQICHIYQKHWPGMNFAAFRDRLLEFHGIKAGILKLTKILNAAGIVSPKWHGPKKEKKKFLPRKERACAGELLQLDASEHDWLMTGEKITLHGAIDDATHEVVGLYFCRHECRLGYSEVIRQVLVIQGVPEAVYIDRHAAFVKNARKNGKTLEERLQYNKDEATHWTDICEEIGTEIILALSPQAKGRVERMWETFQGRLPFLFRYLGIDTIEKANDFLPKYMEMHKKRFAKPPQSEISRYKPIKMTDLQLEALLSVKFEKRTNASGEFVFHGFTFRLEAKRAAFRKFTLCLSEKSGIWARLDGKFYPISLIDPLTDCIGDQMPQVEKDLVARYLLQPSRLPRFSFG